MRDWNKGTGEGQETDRFGGGRHKGRQSSEGRLSASSGHSRPLKPPGQHNWKQEKAGERKCVPSLHLSAPPDTRVYMHTHALRHVAAFPFETLI